MTVAPNTNAPAVDHEMRAKAGPVNSLTVADALAAFAPPDPARSRIQLLRPFIVMSKTSYSTPIVLPIGAAYIGGLMEKAGYGVDIIDAVGEAVGQIDLTEDGRKKRQGLSPAAILDRIDPKAAVLGVSLMFSQEWIEHRDLITEIRARHPDMIIVAGGEHVTAMPQFVLETCPAIDYLVMGEGELTFLELVHRLLAGKPVDGMTGIAYRGADGKVVHTGVGRRIVDFQNLPRPAWHLCPVDSYFGKAFAFGVSFGRNMPILATRGCPYQCTFCSNPTMWTTRYTMRDPADVVDEIEHLIATYGCNSIDFADLTAIVKKQWILDFCVELKRRNVRIVWQLPTGTRAEALDHETLSAIYDAGCRLVVYAPESGSEETLKLINKRLKLQNVLASAAVAAEIGHMTKVNFILGFPGETRRSMLETIWCCLKMATKGVGDCNVAVFSPYPGSLLFKQLVDAGKIDINSDEYFHDLITFFDFTHLRAYNENVPAWEIGIYRFIGLAGFYSASYLLYPKRLWRLLKGVLGHEFKPQSLFEQRVYDAIVRSRRAAD
ncbi:MAG: B12-binding domain-containing radical SAM protein [Actinomycetota bacterium]